VRDALGLTPRLRACRCRRGGRGPCTCNPKKTKTYASFNVREAVRDETRALKAAKKREKEEAS
jgi:hypothetical protein